MQQKATRMDVFVNRLYVLTDFVYEIIKNSFFFWVYLLKGFGIITLFSSIRVLISVSVDVVNKDRKKTFKNFKENYSNTDKSRFSSLFTFFFLLYLAFVILVPFPEHLEGSFLYGMKYMAVFIASVTVLLMFTRPVFDKLFPSMTWSIPVQMYAMIKELKWTFALFGAILFILWFSTQNFIFLFGFSPGLLGVVSSYIGRKITDNMKKMK